MKCSVVLGTMQVMYPNVDSEMANSVDPDQTAPELLD